MQNYHSKFRIIKFVLLILTFNFSLLTLNFNKVYAQQVSLSLSPPILEVMIKPGKSILVAYSVQNHGDPTIVSSGIMPFTPRGTQGGLQHSIQLEGPIRFALDNSRLKLGDSFFLKSGEVQQLLLRVHVPEGAPEGDYYYTFFSQSAAPQHNEGAIASRARATVGANILLTVTTSGKTEAKGRIVQLTTLGGWRGIFESLADIPVKLTVENSGNNLIKAQGELSLIGNFGETTKFTIPPQNVLAHSQRTLLASPSARLKCLNATQNQPQCHSLISLLLSGFFVGRYRITAEVDLGTTTSQLFASTTFWGLPVKLLIAVVLALVTGAAIIKRLGKE